MLNKVQTESIILKYLAPMKKKSSSIIVSPKHCFNRCHFQPKKVWPWGIQGGRTKNNHNCLMPNPMVNTRNGYYAFNKKYVNKYVHLKQYQLKDSDPRYWENQDTHLQRAKQKNILAISCLLLPDYVCVLMAETFRNCSCCSNWRTILKADWWLEKLYLPWCPGCNGGG